MTAAPERPAQPCPATLRGTEPTVVRDEVLGFVQRAITNRPRDLQREIGPSSLGHPCDRAIAYTLAAHPPVGYGRPPWRQTVGTCVDLEFKRWADEANDSPWEDSTRALTDLVGGRDDYGAEVLERFLIGLDQADEHGGRRWWTDLPALVGELYPGRWITGHLDLYDAATAGVIDVKVPGPSQMKKHRAGNRITDGQYRTQVHSYGRGINRVGWPVDWVAILRLPANGELTDATWQWETYDPTVADEALARVGAIARLVDAVGTSAARHLPTVDHYCRRCSWQDDNATDPAVSCPGAPGFDRGYDSSTRRTQPPAAYAALVAPATSVTPKEGTR